jgi:hypothetical protein
MSEAALKASRTPALMSCTASRMERKEENNQKMLEDDGQDCDRPTDRPTNKQMIRQRETRLVSFICEGAENKMI